MNVSCYNSSRSIQLNVLLITALMLTLSLVACSAESEQAATSANTTESAADEESAANYQEKVKKRVSASVVSSFTREWDVPESKVECLLADLDVTQLDDAETDAAVADVFAKCVVDPAVVK